MKKRVARALFHSVLFAFIMFAFYASSCLAESNRVIRIAGDNNFPPFEYISNSGVFTGFNVDILNAVSIETGVKIEYVPMPWNDAVEALRNGKVDAIQGMKYSKIRDEVFDFSQPYFTSSQGMFVLKDNMYIFRLEDVRGRKIAVQKGDIANDLLRELKASEIISTASQEEAIELLLKRKVDAFIGNRITGQYFLQMQNRHSSIKIVGEPIQPTDYGVAVMPEHRELLALINQGIAKIKSNGTYEKIERKWFGEYIMTSASKLQRILLFLEIGLGASAVIFAVVLWWNRLLKKEVTKRTNQITVMNRQLAEKMEMLEENVQFQQQLLDSTYSFYVTTDERCRISLVNRKAVAYLGAGDGMVGRLLADTVISQFIPAEEVIVALKSGSVILQRETLWSSDKGQRVIQYNIYPITRGAQHISGAIINFQDITEQKELERKMEQEDRLRSLGRLMLGIAHEIRNPLTSILTYTQLLPHKFDNAKFRDFFAKQVPSEIQRLNTLITDLLEYAKPKPSHPVSFAVKAQLESVIQLCSQKIKEKKIQLLWQLDESLFVNADIHQTKQIWINVVINALDSMEAGGTLTICGYYENQMTVIEVEDTGEGIAPEDRFKIFEPFYSTKAQGVGLGLSITYQLVKENGGVIDVRSHAGRGTTMIIQLPRPEEGVEAYASSHRY